MRNPQRDLMLLFALILLTVAALSLLWSDADGAPLDDRRPSPTPRTSRGGEIGNPVRWTPTVTYYCSPHSRISWQNPGCARPTTLPPRRPATPTPSW